jgi:hypothetical protein
MRRCPSPRIVLHIERQVSGKESGLLKFRFESTGLTDPASASTRFGHGAAERFSTLFSQGLLRRRGRQSHIHEYIVRIFDRAGFQTRAIPFVRNARFDAPQPRLGGLSTWEPSGAWCYSEQLNSTQSWCELMQYPVPELLNSTHTL